MNNWKYSQTPINNSFKTQQSIFSCIETRIDKITPNDPPYLYACFQLGFFPSNQGLTLANALRRSLLNETTECSITGVIIENVKHEYSSIKGIKETIFDLLMNLKKIIFFSKKSFFKTRISIVSEVGPMVLKAKNLKLPNFIFCINPEQYITTLEINGQLNMTIFLDQSQNLSFLTTHYYSHFYPNFFPFKIKNKNLLNKESSNFLFLETRFCPVKNVNYKIKQLENKKEIIFFEIWTNGSIHPSFLLKKAIQALLINLIPFYLIENQNVKNRYKIKNQKILAQKRFIQRMIKLDLTNFPISFPTYQKLQNHNIYTIGDLYKTKMKIHFINQLTEKELQEIKRLLKYLKYYFLKRFN